MHNDNTNPVLGIDLGTTFSAIARWDGRGPRVYLGRTGDNVLQSAVFYDPEKDELLVGKLAFGRGQVFPDNLALGVKRHMDDADQKIIIGGKEFDPIELSAEILKRLYLDVCDQFPSGVFSSRGTVVTVPYYFKAHQCENTRKAADMADIECLGIIQEPIAASLSYAWQQIQEYPDAEKEENILVFDLGGGTFDLTLFKLEQTKEKISFEVLGTGGDDRLGGMDFDNCMVELLLAKGDLSISDLSDVDQRKARQKLLAAAKEAKEALTFGQEYYVAVPFVVGDKSIDTSVTRNEFEECIHKYVGKVEGVLDGLWISSGTKATDVDRVIRVGGSSRIPRMRKIIEDVIGEEKSYQDPEPDLAVVKGAALYAAHEDNPDVFGREIEIRTRTCHALGVEADGGMFDTIVAANRKAPCEGQALFANAYDNMKGLDINVYQGSKKLVKDNTLIGTINIRDLPPYPREKLDIPVTFTVSEDQNLSVSVEVKDADTGEVIRTEMGAFTYA